MALPNILLFALGIAAIAAPLWAHLRLGRVRKRAVVSSLHLMLATKQSSRTPRRIINWPLFLLRCLLLLLIALGFGRLFIPAFDNKADKSYVAIVVDVSGSMLAENAGQPVWSQTSKALTAAIEKLNPSSSVAIIPSPIGDYQPTWESPSAALARCKKLLPGHAANQLASEIRDAISLLKDMPGDSPKKLQILSDFQRSSLVGTDGLSLPSNIELTVEQFGAPKSSNRGLNVTALSAGATDMSIYSFSDGTNGEVQLIENEVPSTLAIAPGQTFPHVAAESSSSGRIDRRLVLEVPDSLPADNTAYDSFTPQKPLPIWLYEPRSTEDSPSQIYEQASYFINTALQPRIGEETNSLSRFLPKILTKSNLTDALELLEKPDPPRILFIPATQSVPTGLNKLAQGLLDKGGAVIWFSGPELDPEQYKIAFQDILPVDIGSSEPFKINPSLASIDSRHPLWGGLDPQSRRQLTAIGFRERNAIKAADDAKTLAYFADASPFVVEANRKAGRVYFINSSADRSSCDWAANPTLFVPSIHLLTARALSYDSFEPTNAPWIAGEPTSLKLDPTLAGKKIRVAESESIVDQEGFIRNVRVNAPGLYDITDQDGGQIARIAVNFPPNESMLDNYTAAVARQRLESQRIATTESAIRWETMDQTGISWKICLTLAALLLIIEPFVSLKRTSTI